MKIEAEIKVTSDDIDELERITEGLVIARSKTKSRETEIAAKLYGETTPARDSRVEMRAERDAALAARNEAIKDRDYWKMLASKASERALRAERVNRMLHSKRLARKK